MIHLGLLGYPLSHSLSPQLHSAAFHAVGLDGEYRLFSIHPDQVDELAELVGRMRAGKLDGLNVTIPYKQTILLYLDHLTLPARTIGAVNTIYCEDGCLIGHNTDAPGFLSDLKRCLPEAPREKRAFVLGAGGAARAVVYALLSDGWNVSLAVRRADLGQAETLATSFARLTGGESLRICLLESEPLNPVLGQIGLIVNATPLGMYPDSEACPWPEGLALPEATFVYDLVYNPRQTRLLRQASQAGLQTGSGIGMLVEQAALAFETWTGQAPPRLEMMAAVEAE
ncbi:MAG TPA: shikimate dehydrogenase [Anaerolineales bacterium]|nr:shikimate dehydrogenase [Anaerolineales bacterium]